MMMMIIIISGRVYHWLKRRSTREEIKPVRGNDDDDNRLIIIIIISGGVHHRLKRRSTREERKSVTRNDDDDNNNKNNNHKSQEPEGKMGSKTTAWTVSTEPG
jgi:hypothetical protein